MGFLIPGHAGPIKKKDAKLNASRGKKKKKKKKKTYSFEAIPLAQDPRPLNTCRRPNYYSLIAISAHVCPVML